MAPVIGDMRHRITIQQRTETRDALGASVFTWSTLATVWAEVGGAFGSERFTSGVDQEVAQVTHRIRVRYRDDVTPLNRVLYGSKVLDIETAIDPDGRRRELVMMCREEI